MKLAPLALTLSALALGACNANDVTYGVEVLNKTGQILDVTYLNVDSDGTSRPYASTTVSKNGTCTAQVTHAEQEFGKRVRFTIPDRAADDPGASVELKLSDQKIREYDLVIVNGRLVAKEHKKGRPEAGSENPDGAN